MRSGKFNVVVDGQFGSCGKGIASAYLAHKHNVRCVSTTNGPNAGHTAILEDDTKFIGKVLPASAILNKMREHEGMHVYIGPTAAFTEEQLKKEMEECGMESGQIHIHPRAGVIAKRHVDKESSGTKHIASTRQGFGAWSAEKIMRKGASLAGDKKNLEKFVEKEFMPDVIIDKLEAGHTFLHEGAQGFSLDINHGHSYPYCTSRQTTALQMAADMGVPHHMIGDVYMVVRADHSIRVGNIEEDGKTVGYSGDCYPDQEEITWEDIKEKCNTDTDLIEKTTVTQRVRRVFTFSYEEVRRAALVNGATKLIVNFANYIDWSCYGRNGNRTEYNYLHEDIIQFVDKVEKATGLPVSLIGTGPRLDHYVTKTR